MKRIICIIMFFIIIFSQITFAENIKIFMDDRHIKLRPPAILVEDIVYAPFRDILENLGVEDVERDKLRISGKLEKKDIEFIVNSKDVLFDKEKLEMESPVILLNRYPMIPVKDISNILGKEMKYSEIFKTAIIKRHIKPTKFINKTLSIEFDFDTSIDELMESLGNPGEIEDDGFYKYFIYNLNTDNYIKIELLNDVIISVSTDKGNWEIERDEIAEKQLDLKETLPLLK